MNNALLDLIVCPLCKGHLHYERDKKELICSFDRLAFPIKNDIPVLIDSEARLLSLEEVENVRKK